MPFVSQVTVTEHNEQRTVLDVAGNLGYCTFEVLEQYDTKTACTSVGNCQTVRSNE